MSTSAMTTLHLRHGQDDNGTGVPCVAWEAEPVNITADSAMGQPREAPGPEPEGLTAAVEWLKRALASGPRTSKDVEEEAREVEGISRPTLHRARRMAGVDAYRPANPGPWWLRLGGQDIRALAQSQAHPPI